MPPCQADAARMAPWHCAVFLNLAAKVPAHARRANRAPAGHARRTLPAYPAVRSGIVGQREERPAVSTRGFVSPLLSRAFLLRPHEQRLALFARARSVREKNL